MSSPAVPTRGCTRPLSVHAFPTHGPLLRPETRLSKPASPVAVRLAASKHRFENVSSFISTIWVVHGHNPPFFGADVGSQSQALLERGKKSPTEFEDEAEQTIASPSLALG